MTEQIEFDLEFGERLKKHALDLVENSTEARAEWVAAARAVARRIAIEQGEVCSDEVRAECPVPLGIDPRILGAVFNTKAWIRVGLKPTAVAHAHKRPISVWSLK